MLLERTISQLDTGPVAPNREELGQIGYMPWLGALRPIAYRMEAMRAYAAAQPFIRISPAVAVFCDLLVTRMPVEPLPLTLPARDRRGDMTA